MKKIFITLFTLLCVICCIFSLVACNGTPSPAAENNSDNSGNNDTIQSGDGGNASESGNDTNLSSGITLTEDTDFAALVSDKVTQAEWENAFSEAAFTNVTVKEGIENDYAYWKIQSNGENKLIRINDNAIMNHYISFESDNNYFYTAEDNSENYERYILSNAIIEELDGGCICPNFSDYYSNFSYDAETSSYICSGTRITANFINGLFTYTNEYTMTYSNISVKIADGKIACITCNISYESDSSTFDFYMYDYGTTTVELPKDYVDVDN